MKLLKYILVIIVLFCVSCDEQDNTPIQYLTTVLGGCNNERNYNEETDAIIISVTDNNIHVFVRKNYTCGAPFETQCKVTNDTIFMYIIDACEDILECYERCICYYTFDFVFNLGKLNQNYKIVFIDPRKEIPEILEVNNFQNKVSIHGRESVILNPGFEAKAGSLVRISTGEQAHVHTN